MITVGQISRQWKEKAYNAIARSLLANRPENCPRLVCELSRPAPAAALALIRLDELNQNADPVCRTLIHAVLDAQEADGGWGDPLTTAVCLRALMASRGQGLAIDRGLAYLAGLQKADGLWPREPIRRLAGDPFVTACILLQLGDDARFADSANIPAALTWLDHAAHLDSDTRRLLTIVALRCRHPRPRPVPAAA